MPSQQVKQVISKLKLISAFKDIGNGSISNQ
jgi:hypothetical protein